jgi:hypothetical protein
MNRLRKFGESRYGSETMSQMGVNRIELVCWLAIVADLLVVFTSRPQFPHAAQASSVSKPAVAVTSPEACQAVVEQIVSIARDESAKTNLRGVQPLAVVDQCINRQEQIDTAGCPADFKIAERRFLSAEQSLCRDAQMDFNSNPDVVQRAFFAVYEHRSPYDTLDRMSDKIRRDLDIFQTAAFDFIQVSASYDVQ